MPKLRSLAAIAFLTTLTSGCSIDHPEGYPPPALTMSNSSGSSLSDDWLTYGRDYGNQRFSPMRDIRASNVAYLIPAYVFQTGVAGAFETNPLVTDGVMYLTTAYDGVFAIDATSGVLRWKVDPLRGHFRQCCGPVNRGVALSQTFVLVGRLDGSVVALDRQTGAMKWRTRVADNALGYSITSAPLVYRDLVIVGVGGGDLGIRGSLIALSLSDGKVRWRWFATNSQHCGVA